MTDKWNDTKVLAKVKQFYEDRMGTACEVLETDMREKTSGSQGEALRATDKLNFLNSFSHKVISEGTAVIGLVGNSAEYAPYIEFGTGEFAEGGDGRKGGWAYVDDKGNFHFTLGMKPRPIHRTALIEKKKDILKIFEE